MSVKLSHQYAPEPRRLLHNGISLIAVFALWIIGVAGEAHAQQQSEKQSQTPGGKPNILVIFGGDIGQSNVSAYGYNQLPYLTGKEPHSARKEFIYFNDDGDLVALRYENWKLVFEEQRSPGTLEVWAEPFTKLRLMKMYDLRADPFERADITSNTYWDWLLDHAFIAYGAQAYVAKFLNTFKEFPPSQRAATFTIDQAMDKLKQNLGD